MVNTKIVARPWCPQDLLDDLQDLIDEECDSYLNTRRTTLCTAKAYLEEHFAEPRWIPVTERLPREEDADADRCVLAIHKVAKKQYYHWRTVVDNPFDFTHWKRLPEPPKGE